MTDLDEALVRAGRYLRSWKVYVKDGIITRDGAPREERMGAGQATRLLTRWPEVLKL